MTWVMLCRLRFGGINLCIKSGLNTFPPLPNKFTCSKSRCTYIWGVVQRREYAKLHGQIQNGILPLEAWWFFDSKLDQNIPLWNQKWKGNVLQNTRLPRNGRLSPKSDDDMNGSCMKTQTPRIWSQLKLTSNWFKFVPWGCSKEPLILLLLLLFYFSLFWLAPTQCLPVWLVSMFVL